MGFAPGCFCGLRFGGVSIVSPFAKSENARLGCPCQICHRSDLRALLKPRFAAKCCPMFAV